MGDVVAVVSHRGDLSAQARSDTLEEAVNLIGGLKGSRSPFVIKPNLCTHPQLDITRFATTDVRMVEALAGLALREDEHLSIKIVESDSMDKYANEATWRAFGYRDLSNRLIGSGHDVSLINLSEPPLVKMRVDGEYFKELEINELLARPMYLASVAIAKTHPITYVTGVIKNLFGLLPRKRKIFYHPVDNSTDFNNVIVDLARFLTPDLCIVDAIVGMEDVIHGRLRRVNTMIVGKKPASVDATMARIMGFEPEKIRHLVEAERHGLGSLYPETVGERIESVTVQFKPTANPRPKALVA
jgi:uncharacterized protein (DUF362 family)